MVAGLLRPEGQPSRAWSMFRQRRDASGELRGPAVCTAWNTLGLGRKPSLCKHLGLPLAVMGPWVLLRSGCSVAGAREALPGISAVAIIELS